MSRRRPQVLCVDDEPLVLEGLQDVLHRRFRVVTTTNGFEALRLLVEEPFPVVLSDMRMPRIDGARFLTLAREHAPATVRLLLTGQSTLDDAVTAVNDGQIFRILIKPCSTERLIAAIDSAIQRYEADARERDVSERLVAGAVEALCAMADKVDPTSSRRAARLARYVAELREHAPGAPPAAVLERAVRLSQIGSVGLSAETRATLAAGRPLGHQQVDELVKLPELSLRLFGDIPRLESERLILAHLASPFAATRHGSAGTPWGARLLRIAFDFDLLLAEGSSAAGAVATMRSDPQRYDPGLLDTCSESLARL